MATWAVRVTGLAELNRAFRKMSGDLDKELRQSLKDAASPVADLAESLALSRIRNMPRSPDWAGMRVGVSGKAVVYIVPRRRNRGNPGRPNLKGLLLSQAMEPAAEQKQDEVVKGVERMIDKLAGKAGF